MSPQPTWTRGPSVALAATMALVGCKSVEGPAPATARPILETAVVSNPVTGTVSAAPALSGSAVGSVVYVSLTPGGVPGGEEATIANPRTGARGIVPMVDGGFDPVSVEASAGDTLDLDIRVAGADAPLAYAIIVPERRPPVVVRTDPPPKKRDVPLNMVLLVVFSEPIDAATLTTSGLQLWRDGTPVAGTLAFGDEASLVVTFTPADPLVAGAEYTLLVTQAITDLTGEALQVPVTVEFTADVTTQSGIYVASADGSGASWLIRGSRPAWSPDGQRIAFHRLGEIYVIDADGSNEALLTKGTDPAWSPDGRSIVFADGTGISVMALGSSATVQLIDRDFLAGVTPPTGVGRPAWSPDGGSIAFEHYGDDNVPVQIFVMNADGSAPRRLTDTPGVTYAESDPSWSADGAWVVFWSYGFGIAVVDATGTDPRTVYLDLPDVAYGARPDLSPDGSTVVFAGFPDSSRGQGPAAWSLYVVARNGSGLRLLIPGGYDGEWSPDGTRIAFVRGSP